MEGKVERFKDREKTVFGDLSYTVYFDTDLLSSGVATIAPHGKSDLDEGHKDSEEVFTVARGSLVITFPDSNLKYELGTGDSLLIPPGEPHIVENLNDEEAVLVFTGVPGL